MGAALRVARGIRTKQEPLLLGEKRLEVFKPPPASTRVPFPDAHEGAEYQARRLELALELDQTLERFQKILKRGSREHDRVTPSAYVFGDFQKPPTLIFFEVEKEDFAIIHNLFGSDRIGSHSLSRIIIHHFCRWLSCFSSPTAGWQGAHPRQLTGQRNRKIR